MDPLEQIRALLTKGLNPMGGPAGIVARKARSLNPENRRQAADAIGDTMGNINKVDYEGQAAGVDPLGGRLRATQEGTLFDMFKNLTDSEDDREYRRIMGMINNSLESVDDPVRGAYKPFNDARDKILESEAAKKYAEMSGLGGRMDLVSKYNPLGAAGKIRRSLTNQMSQLKPSR